MRLLVDTSAVTFTVSKATEAKKDQDGKQRADRRTGELLYVVQLVALDGTGAEVITVTVAGQPPKLTVGQVVMPVELEAIPWVQEKRHGTSFRAKDIRPVQVGKASQNAS